MGTLLPLPKRGEPPNFRPMWPNGWMDQDSTWHGGRPQPRRLCVRRGPSPPPHKGVERPPQFSAHFYCGQTVGYIKMALGMEVGLSPGDFVLNGDLAPSRKRGLMGGASHLPPFSAHGYCGQTAAWIKMPLGSKVGDIIRWGPSSSAQKG